MQIFIDTNDCTAVLAVLATNNVNVCSSPSSRQILCPVWNRFWADFHLDPLPSFLERSHIQIRYLEQALFIRSVIKRHKWRIDN